MKDQYFNYIMVVNAPLGRAVMTADYYSNQTPGKWLDKLSLKKRLEMLQIFFRLFPGNQTASVLDVGVTADQTALTSNFFEEHYPVKSKIIAVSTQDASYLEDKYPGLIFKLGDARALPLADNSVDVVFSSAVIEHVGSYAEQKRMIAECFRVAKHGVFITTPNRWYPVEFHTLLPFIHWLPKPLHRMLLKLIGMSFFASEANLNLMDRKRLARICREIGIVNYTIKSIRTFGLKSNLILVINK